MRPRELLCAAYRSIFGSASVIRDAASPWEGRRVSRADSLTEMMLRRWVLAVFFCLVGCSFAPSKSGDADRFFREANRLYAQGKYTEAAEELQRLIAQYPENPRLFNNLGNVYFKQGRSEEARNQYRRALELNPGYAIATANLAVLSLKSGRTEEALETFHQNLATYPDYPEGHNGLGVCELQQGRVEAAVTHFRKAIDLNGGAPPMFNNLAYAYAESNIYLNEAMSMAKEILESDPDNPAFLDTLGWVYFKRGVFEQSVDALRAALEEEPASEVIRSHLSTVYRWTGRDDEAMALAVEGIRLRHRESH